MWMRKTIAAFYVVYSILELKSLTWLILNSCANQAKCFLLYRIFFGQSYRLLNRRLMHVDYILLFYYFSFDNWLHFILILTCWLKLNVIKKKTCWLYYCEKKPVGCIIFDVCVGMQLNIIFIFLRIQCRPFVSQTIFFIKKWTCTCYFRNNFRKW
jgi:hypothetical protein